MKLNKEKGFTLIELLVVIAIIGVLSTLAVVSLNNARQKSRDSKRVSDIKQIQNALELYYNDVNGYPDAQAAITLGSTNYASLSSGAGFSSSSTASGVKYMQQVPSAPTPADNTCDSTSNSYRYTSTASTTYTIDYCLGASTGGVAAGVNKACQAGLAGC